MTRQNTHVLLERPSSTVPCRHNRPNGQDRSRGLEAGVQTQILALLTAAPGNQLHTVSCPVPYKKRPPKGRGRKGGQASGCGAGHRQPTSASSWLLGKGWCKTPGYWQQYPKVQAPISTASPSLFSRLNDQGRRPEPKPEFTQQSSQHIF